MDEADVQRVEELAKDKNHVDYAGEPRSPETALERALAAMNARGIHLKVDERQYEGVPIVTFVGAGDEPGRRVRRSDVIPGLDEKETDEERRRRFIWREGDIEELPRRKKPPRKPKKKPKTPKDGGTANLGDGDG